MSLLISRLMVFLAAVSMTSLAFADSDYPQITGRSCKEYIRTGVISQTWAEILTSSANITSPLTTPIKDIAAINLDLNTAVGVRNAVEHTQAFIQGCARHCSGLRGANNALFNCERIGDANSNQLNAFASTDRYMADDVVSELTEAQLAELFGTQEQNEAPAVTPNVVVEEEVQQNNTAPVNNIVLPEQKIVL